MMISLRSLYRLWLQGKFEGCMVSRPVSHGMAGQTTFFGQKRYSRATFWAEYACLVGSFFQFPPDFLMQ